MLHPPYFFLFQWCIHKDGTPQRDAISYVISFFGRENQLKIYLAYKATMVSYFSCLPEICLGSSTFLPYS